MLNVVPQRHDLLFITSTGRRYAWENRVSSHEWDDGLWRSFSEVPAICRSQTNSADSEWIDVGFSFPVRFNGVRRRIAARIPLCEIERRVSAEEAAQCGLEGPAGQLTRCLLECAQSRRIPFGIFGAAALQAVTGLPYLHETSDLDVVLYPASFRGLREFDGDMQRLENQFGIRTDAELSIDGEWYLKLRELLSSQNTILAKKRSGDPELLSCRAVWKSLGCGCHRNTTIFKRSLYDGN